MADKQLQGQWLASVAEHEGAVRLNLGPHPDWAGMVKGTVQWNEASYAMVGDVNEGQVTLEESADGERITGTWLGDLVEASCGREIRGQYQAGEDQPWRDFVLRKTTP